MSRKITRDELEAANAVDSGHHASNQAAIPLSWDGGAMRMNEMIVENPDGSTHVVDFNALAQCAAGGTSTYYESFYTTGFRHDWHAHTGDQVEAGDPCTYDAWEGYDHQLSQINMINFDRMEEVNASSGLGSLHTYGEGNCIDDFIDTYGLVQNSKIYFDWSVPLIKNPLREQAKILGIAPPEETQVRILMDWYSYNTDEYAGNASWGYGAAEIACRENTVYNVSCPGGIKTETNIVLDNCGGTVKHQFVVDAFAGVPGDEWFTHEYRPLVELHDLELPIYSPLAYCAGAEITLQ